MWFFKFLELDKTFPQMLHVRLATAKDGWDGVDDALASEAICSVDSVGPANRIFQLYTGIDIEFFHKRISLT